MSDNASSQPLQVTVNIQYVKDFSFESPNAPQVFMPTDKQPTINMGVNVQVHPVGDQSHEVLLLTKLEAQVEDKTAFIVELSYGGVFSLPPMPVEQQEIFLFVEAPRLLFPFTRQIIANAIRDGGFPQILINPIDFYALYENNKREMEKPVAGAA
jgi:preprotein translocase subunit SecB